MPDVLAAKLDHLASLELFSGLPPEVLARLSGQCGWQQVPGGAALIDGTGRPHGVFFLAEGEVEVHGHGPSHGRLPVARLAAVACFGEFAAVCGEPGSVSVRAATPCVIGEMPSAAFLGLLADHPPISLRPLAAWRTTSGRSTGNWRRRATISGGSTRTIAGAWSGVCNGSRRRAPADAGRASGHPRAPVVVP